MTETAQGNCVRIRLALAFGRFARLHATGLGLLLLFTGQVRATEATSSVKTPDLTELPLETLMQIEVPKVYSASKFEQTITEAPASVTVVTAEEIKRYGYRTLGDVLESAPGFLVSYDRNYSFLGVRGMSLGDFNSRVLLLVDGHRINGNLNDAAFIGNEFILDLDLAERVEIIRGPGSVLYGNNAFFGVINVVTRKGAQINGVEASAEYGSFDTYKGRFTIGKAFTNGLEFLLSGTLYQSDGPDQLFFPEYNTPAQNNGIAEHRDGESFGSFFGSVSYYDFTLEGAYIKRNKDNPTAQYFTTFNDSRLSTTDDRSYVNLKFAHEFPEVVDVTAQVYYDSVDFDIGYPFGGPPATTFYKETQSGQWWGAELQLKKRLWDKHIVSLGGEYRDDFSQSDHVFDPQTGQTFTQVSRTRQAYGVYGKGDFALLEDLHLNAGLRYDQYGDFEPSWNPRLGLICEAFAQSTFKALYGTAFRTPNFQELSDPRFQNLSPEDIASYSLVYEQGIGRNLRTSLDLFYNQMNDLIVFQNGSYTNLDADSLGLEAAIEGFWASGIRGRASYTLQTVQNVSHGEDLPDSPHHMVKLSLSAPIVREKIFAGVEFLYTSQRGTEYTTTTGQTLSGGDVPAFGVVNLTLFSQKLVKNLEFSASVYNLLDQQYFDPASRFHLQSRIEQDGRTFRLKLTYRF